MEKFDEVVQALKESRPDHDFLVISSPISRDLHYKLSSLLAKKKKKIAVLYFLPLMAEIQMVDTVLLDVCVITIQNFCALLLRAGVKVQEHLLQ